MLSEESIKYSIRNIMHRKSRSFLTIASIFIGITAIFVFVSFGLGLYNYVDALSSESNANKLSITPKGIGIPGTDDAFALTEKDLDAIEGVTGVYEASGMYTKAVEINQRETKKFVFLVGYDPEVPIVMELFDAKIRKGRFLQERDSGVLLGFNYLLENKIFPRDYDINEDIEIQGIKYRVIGFLEPVGNPQDDSNIYVTSDLFKEILPETKGFALIVASVDTSNMRNIINNVEKELRKSRGLEKGKEDFFVESFEDLIGQFSGALNIIIGFVVLIALVSLIVSAVNTANTMVTSVLERVKEIGVIKSIGAKNSEVFSIFVFESAFLGFLGGVIGVIFGFLISFIAGNILDGLGWGFLVPIYPWYLFLGLIAFASIIGAISGALPARNASKIKPVEALRYE